MPLQLHADECVSAAIVQGLKRCGIDVRRAPDLGLLGAGDTTHFARSVSDNLVIVASDDDFLKLAAKFQAQSKDFRGLIYFRITVGTGTAVRAIFDIATILDPRDMTNRIEFVS